MNRNREVEDGFGCSGLVPTAAERRQEEYESRQRRELEALRTTVADLRELFRIDGEQHAAHVKQLTAAHEGRITKYADVIAQLRAELAEARADGERYRALRAMLVACGTSPIYPQAKVEIWLSENSFFGIIGAESRVGIISLDDAIDAALSARAKENSDGKEAA